MHNKRTVEHYKGHELVIELSYETGGWGFTMHVLGHEGDLDKLRCEECSAEYFRNDIDALVAARARGHAVIDRIVAQKNTGQSE